MDKQENVIIEIIITICYGYLSLFSCLQKKQSSQITQIS